MSPQDDPSRLPLPPLEPISYASPPPARRVQIKFSWGVCLWSAALFAGMVAISIFVMPQLENAYRDFHVEFPLSTQILARGLRFIRAGGYAVLGIVSICLGFFFGSLNPARRKWFRMILTLLMAGLVVFTILALLLPYVKLMDSIIDSKR